MGSEWSRIPRRMTASRRRLLISALATFVTGVSAVASGTHSATVQAAAAPRSPNVLVIESDDQTLESMRVMNNVNSLIGAEGATFQNSFVNYSLCCPSRATFLTGDYMHNHRVLSNKYPSGGFGRFEELHGNWNLAVWLQRAGYYTAMIGKYLNEYANDPPVPPGWSEWRTGANQKVYGYTLDENGTLVRYGQDPADFKQDVLTRKAVNFVARRAPGRGRSSSGSPTRRPTGPLRTRTRTRRPTAASPRSRRRATPMRSTPSRCRGPRTSTSRTSPTSPLRSAIARA